MFYILYYRKTPTRKMAADMASGYQPFDIADWCRKTLLLNYLVLFSGGVKDVEGVAQELE